MKNQELRVSSPFEKIKAKKKLKIGVPPPTTGTTLDGSKIWSALKNQKTAQRKEAPAKKLRTIWEVLGISKLINGIIKTAKPLKSPT